MNRTSGRSPAIVVALTDPAPPRLAASLAALAEEAGPSGEVLLVDASGTSGFRGWLADMITSGSSPGPPAGSPRRSGATGSGRPTRPSSPSRPPR